MLPVSVLIHFKIVEKASVEEKLFSKSSEEIFAFCSSVENSGTFIRMFKKGALLEISGRPLLVGVTGLQSAVCTNTKNRLLTTFLKGVQTCRKFPGSNFYWSFFLVNYRPENLSL